MSDGTKYWDDLGAQIENDVLYLDPDMAREYSAAINALIIGFGEVIEEIRQASNVDGLGDFDCANELRDYLRAFFHGHPGSITTVLGQHVDYQRAMDLAVNKAIAGMVDKDDQVAGLIPGGEK